MDDRGKSLRETVETVARQLGIIDLTGQAKPDPENIDDAYLKSVSTTSRAFLVLCSSELEEYVEARCLDFLHSSLSASDSQLEHNSLHALSIHFRKNLGNLIESKGWFVDFYATDEQARKFADERKKQRREGKSATETEGPPILNRKTVAAKLCDWYRQHVVGPSHGINDQDLIGLLTPLGFSENLVQDECPTLLPALKSLAGARGEAAHRAAHADGWPFKPLHPPLEQQMSLGDAWSRWEAVVNALPELEDLLSDAEHAGKGAEPTREPSGQ